MTGQNAFCHKVPKAGKEGVIGEGWNWKSDTEEVLFWPSSNQFILKVTQPGVGLQIQQLENQSNIFGTEGNPQNHTQ